MNMRPLGYEPNELPGCSTPHLNNTNITVGRSTKCRIMFRFESTTEAQVEFFGWSADSRPCGALD